MDHGDGIVFEPFARKHFHCAIGDGVLGHVSIMVQVQRRAQALYAYSGHSRKRRFKSRNSMIGLSAKCEFVHQLILRLQRKSGSTGRAAVLTAAVEGRI